MWTPRDWRMLTGIMMLGGGGLNRAAFVQPSFGFNIGLPSVFLDFIKPKVHGLLVHLYRCLPFSPLLVPNNTKNAVPIIAQGAVKILAINPRRYDAKIIPAVVVRNAIDVVNFQVRPRPFHQKKSEPVQLDIVLAEADTKMPPSLPRPDRHPQSASASAFLLPKKMAAFRVIRNIFADIGDCGKAPFSHVADSLRSGQGRALLTQRFRPVFSSRITICSQALRAA